MTQGSFLCISDLRATLRQRAPERLCVCGLQVLMSTMSEIKTIHMKLKMVRFEK